VCASVGQIERGEKNISFDNLAKVAEALGVTMSTLLDGIENGTKRVRPGVIRRDGDYAAK
jgi:transcriptional regulator with XRE-family HTH domain